MGNLVLFGHPPYGHITPAIRLGRELVRRGGRVRIYACDRSRAAIEAAGAEFRAYPAPYERFDPTPATLGLFHDMARLLALSRDMLPALLREMASDPPDAVLMDTKAVWARLLGQKLGCPACTLSVVFAIHGGAVATRQLLPQLLGGAPPPALRASLAALQRYGNEAGRLGREFGVRCPDIVEFLGNPQPLNIVFTTREFQIQAEAFDERYVFVGPLMPSTARGPEFDWTVLRRPLLYVSLGTTFYDAPGFYADCYRAFRDAPAQVVISCGRLARELPPPPPNMLLFESVPQVPLLAGADAIVTHGGMNSANEALALGLPQLVVPQRGDQHLVARRVVELGAGLAWHPGDGWEALRSRAFELLENPVYRRRASALAEAARAAGGAAAAADAVLQRLGA